MTNNSDYNKDKFTSDQSKSTLSEESKARAASLLNFISSVKESSDYIYGDKDTAENQDDFMSNAKSADIGNVSDKKNGTSDDIIDANDEKENIHSFDKEFNPALAFYEEEEHISTPIQEKNVVDKPTEDVSVTEDAPKKFERIGARKAVPVIKDSEPAIVKTEPVEKSEKKIKNIFKKTKHDKQEEDIPQNHPKKKSAISAFLDENNKTDDVKVNFENTPLPKDNSKQTIKADKKKSVKKFALAPKKAIAAAVVAVFVLATLVLGAKGLITVFATDDIYGIFVDGRLVAATNEEGKMEEAIDDFLAYYKVLEEQGSISNLRFTNTYEIRQLSRDEVKAGIYTAKNTTTATTQSQTTQSISDETDTAQQTTAQTTETTVATTTAVQTDANGNTTHATANQANPINKEGDKLIVSQNVDDIKNVLFYGEVPELYKVVEGDNLYKIAKRKNLTLTELMVPNPDLLEDSTIGIDQEIRVVKMSGPLKLSFSREVTVTEDIPFETVEEKTDQLFEGEKQVTQEGKEGIRQEITKYDYENNVIAVKTLISDEKLEEPTKKIVKVGTKPKTDPNQSSGVTNSTSSSSSSGYIWPVNGARLSSKFGPRKAPKKGASSYHRGIDLAIGSGTPIYATRSGTVTIASYVGGYGNLVELNHGGGMTSRYGHCSKLAVKRGQKVNQGDIIAYVGNTGVSTGPHLHFEIRKGGTAVNPLNYLK